MQDIALTSQNVSLSDPKLMPIRSIAETPASADFAGEKGPIKAVNVLTQKTPLTLSKKTLPPEIRDHFEANSSSFVAFAQKKNSGTAQKIEGTVEEDVWDRALLFGEYPGGKIPVVIDTKAGKVTVSIPKKPEQKNYKNILPNQFFEESNTSIIPEKKENRPITPISIHVEKITLPRFVPKKPGNIPETDIETAVPQKSVVIPVKVPQQPEKDHAEIVPSKQDIGASLQQKIIEGQMRSIFENAPAGIRESLEKMPAQEILSLKDMSDMDQNSDYFWKKRLRDHLLKLKWQGETALKNPWDTDPKEGETVMSFVQRIYPLVIKTETIET